MGRQHSRVSSVRRASSESPNSWATSRIGTVRDFYDVFESVAWLWRVLGIFPMIVHDRRGKKIYESSKFYFAYNILIFAVVIGDMIYTITSKTQEFCHLTFVLKSSIFIRSTSGFLLISFSNVWRIIAVKEFLKAINDSSEENKIFDKSSGPLNHDTFTKIIRIYVWTMFLIVTSFVVWNIFITYDRTGSIPVEWIIWLAPNITQTMDLTILGSLVGWLGWKFYFLNERLSDVVVRSNASSPKVVVTSNVSADSLRVLSKAHYDMCAIGREINRAFNFSVIVSVTTSFLTVSSTLYFIFHEVRRDGEMDYGVMVWYVTVVLTYSIPIIAIVIICHWTSGQAMDAGILIHEVRVEKADSLLYNAVKSFSLQMHHQKLEFTAAGFFPLNSSLLQTMAGTITTYLVILIQFEPKV